MEQLRFKTTFVKDETLGNGILLSAPEGDKWNEDQVDEFLARVLLRLSGNQLEERSIV